MSESQLVSAIIKRYWKHESIFIWRANSGKVKVIGGWMQLNIPGTPDLIGFIKPSGRFLGIECKFGKGEQRETQIAFQERLESFGGLYILARSLEDVELGLTQALNPTF